MLGHTSKVSETEVLLTVTHRLEFSILYFFVDNFCLERLNFEVNFY